MALIMLLSTIYDIWSTSFESKFENILFSFEDYDDLIYLENRISALITFSIYTNGQKIFRCKKRQSEDVMYCLNGIRVLSIMWVIITHTFNHMFIEPLVNPIQILQVSNLHSR